MGSLRLKVSEEDFHNFGSTRVQQGDVSAGPEVQGTILGSCVCIGFYHPESSIGAISHITGFRSTAGNTPRGALASLRKALLKHGLKPRDCECFVIGGSVRSKQVYDETVRALSEKGIQFDALDVLGQFHRKVMLDPAAGVVTLFKKPLATANAANTDKAYSLFHDPSRRLVTGASMYFRNKALLDCLTETALPSCLDEGERVHIWCAGCSIGLEAYCIGMVILDWLRLNQRRAGLKVLGTDISEEALQRAEKGEYPYGGKGKDTDEYFPLLERYTEARPGGIRRISDAVRAVTLFKQRDIRVGSRSHRFEVVVCDHVFQYFEEDVQTEFLDALAPAVRSRGFLYLSTPSNAIRDAVCRRHPFERLSRDFYRKK